MSFQPASLPRSRRVLFAGISVLLGTAAGLLTAEGVLRVREVLSAPSKDEPELHLPIFTPNPAGSGSYRLSPHTRIEVPVGDQVVTLRTNAFGMPWHDVELAPRPGRRRLIFLGDSFAMGCWARDAAHGFVGVVESQLDPERYEVLNFAVGGHGPEDYALLLEEEALRFAPNWVVVAIFNGNDFRDAYLGLHKDRIVDGTAELREDLIRERVPPEYLKHRGPVSRPAAESLARRTLRRSAVFRAAAPWLRLENLGLEFAASPQFTQYSFWSRVPFPPVAQQARDTVLAALQRMGASAARVGAQLAIVSIPTAEQVHAVEATGRDFDIGLPQVYLQTWARERGIPYLDLLPAFRARVAEANERLYLQGDPHWNDAGHALAGRAIASWFVRSVRGAARLGTAPSARAGRR